MGSIKESKSNDSKEFDLSDFDMNYIKALNNGGITSYNYFRGLVQTYLANLAGSKWGYNQDAVLDFEIDQENKKVKVSTAVDKSKK